MVATTDMQIDLRSAILGAAQHMISRNAVSGSPYYQKLDTAAVGAAGHSSGAQGSFNAANLPGGSIITSIATVELPTPDYIALFGQRPDLSTIYQPVFQINTTGDFLISTFWSQLTYDGELTGPAVRAQFVGGDHNTIQAPGPNPLAGYLTAWFMYTLQGDAVASSAFVESSPELNTNLKWINQAEKNLPEPAPGAATASVPPRRPAAGRDATGRRATSKRTAAGGTASDARDHCRAGRFDVARGARELGRMRLLHSSRVRSRGVPAHARAGRRAGARRRAR